ncbi:hypothetical protein E3N88_13408 [Mikania micrantha]|uniref:Uncharacterized protein n=1 Tax=Mikania micrantha TaxID=192012 RepID=A0A5N6P9M6_9ASTR|nr:hypothetical protein E3N88_13408 [Mikania micrantha]
MKDEVVTLKILMYGSPLTSNDQCGDFEYRPECHKRFDDFWDDKELEDVPQDSLTNMAKEIATGDSTMSGVVRALESDTLEVLDEKHAGEIQTNKAQQVLLDGYPKNNLEISANFSDTSQFLLLPEVIGASPAESEVQNGCGYSRLSKQLYDNGFCCIPNIDFSKVVIGDMLKWNVHSYPCMWWRVMDMTRVQFANKSFALTSQKILDYVIYDKVDGQLGQPFLPNNGHAFHQLTFDTCEGWIQWEDLLTSEGAQKKIGENGNKKTNFSSKPKKKRNWKRIKAAPQHESNKSLDWELLDHKIAWETSMATALSCDPVACNLDLASANKSCIIMVEDMKVWIEKSDGKDFGWWKMQIEDSLAPKGLDMYAVCKLWAECEGQAVYVDVEPESSIKISPAIGKITATMVRQIYETDLFAQGLAIGKRHVRCWIKKRVCWVSKIETAKMKYGKCLSITNIKIILPMIGFKSFGAREIWCNMICGPHVRKPEEDDCERKSA